MSAGPSQIMTGGGTYFDLANPKPVDVHLSDIDQALNRIVRFNGHTRRAITVAEHCLRVRRISVSVYGPDKTREALALLHDAAEAYIGDIVRPLKRGLLCDFFEFDRITRIEEFENRILEAIFMRTAGELGLPCRYEAETWDEIKACDSAALYFEAMIEQTGASDWAMWPKEFATVSSLLPTYAPREDRGWLGELRGLKS